MIEFLGSIYNLTKEQGVKEITISLSFPLLAKLDTYLYDNLKDYIPVTHNSGSIIDSHSGKVTQIRTIDDVLIIFVAQ